MIREDLARRVALGTACFCVLFAHESPAAHSTASNLSVVSQAGPEIRKGTLQNGLQYYIVHSAEEPGRAAARLVLRGGPVHEGAKRRNYVHLLEHLLTSAKMQGDPRSFRDRAADIGATQLGTDAQAATSYDSSHYWLRFAANDSSHIDKALAILSTMATASFDDIAVERERRAVLEEMREGESANGRFITRYRPFLLGWDAFGTQEAVRADVTAATPAALRLLQAQWLHPANMAVIVAGDIDPGVAEAAIRARFGALTASPGAIALQPTAPTRPRKSGTLVLTDPNATELALQLYFKRAGNLDRSVKDIQNRGAELLVTEMLSERLRRIASRNGSPFIQNPAADAADPIVPGLDAVSFRALVREGALPAAVATLANFTQAIERDGFSDFELADARDKVGARIAPSGAIPAWHIAAELSNAFVANGTALTPQGKSALIRGAVAKLTLNEANFRVRAWLAVRPRDILILAPEKFAASLLDRAAIERAWRAGSTAPSPAWRPERPASSLRLQLPVAADAGPATATHFAPSGITRLIYPGGITILLRPDPAAPRLRFAALSQAGPMPEGTAYAAEVGEFGGVAGLDRFALARFEEDRDAQVRSGLYESGRTATVTGSAAPAQLSDLLGLIRAYMIAPAIDAEARDSWIASEKAKAAAAPSGSTRFEELIDARLRGTAPAKPAKPASAEAMLAAYRERFGNAANFIFVLTGPFDLSDAEPLLARNIGSLPVGTAPVLPRSEGKALIYGAMSETFPVNTEERATVQLIFSGPASWSASSQASADAAAELLRDQLYQRLREVENGTYGVWSWATIERRPGSLTIGVGFNCAPDAAGRLTAAAREEVTRLLSQPPSAGALEKALSARRVFRKTADYEASRLAKRYLDEGGTDAVFDPPDTLEPNPDAWLAFARRYLTDSRLKQFTLVPAPP